MSSWVIKQGDVLDVLRKIKDDSIDCVLTSPPYWGLRDYKVDGQFGREGNYSEYLEKLSIICRDIFRVIKPSGSFFINIGDSYCNKSGIDGVRKKSLVGIPQRLFLSLIDQGWIVRQEIIWRKSNPMPESVTDRCTRCHEHIFHCVKSEKYYWDKTAISTPAKDCSIARRSQGSKNQKGAKTNGNMKDACSSTMKNLQVPGRKSHTLHINRLIKQNELDKANYTGFNSRYSPVLMANARDVWDISTKGFKGAHFAVFPEELAKRCILAGCPENGIVFDPFCGSGTSGVVSIRHGRRFIGGELNPEYCSMAEQRITEELIKK